MIPGPRRPVSLHKLEVGLTGGLGCCASRDQGHGGVLIRGTPSSIPSTYNASYYMGSLTPGASGRTLIDATVCLSSPHPV